MQMLDVQITEGLFTAAINYKRCVAVNYHLLSRVVEPYMLRTDTHGKRVLLVYQVSGGDESGDALGWKLLAIDEFIGANILGDCARIEGRELPQHLLDAIGIDGGRIC